MTDFSETTGFIAYYTDETGGLPVVLAWERTEHAADAAFRKEIIDNDLGINPDDVEIDHVDLHNDRNDYPYEEWVLFGQPYVPDKFDVAVHHGAKAHGE